MDIIRRKTDYGLRALVAIARADEPVSAEELAAQEEAPVAFLHKALRNLVEAGMVDGQRGPAGGFTLARPAEKISVLEAVEAMQGPVAVSRCLLGDQKCPRAASCGLRPAWEKVQEQIAAFLADLTVEDLVQSLPPAEARGSGRTTKRTENAGRTLVSAARGEQS
jgi:Rrf2 family protein